MIGCCSLVIVVVVGRLAVPRSRIVAAPNSVAPTEGRLSAEIAETAGTRPKHAVNSVRVLVLQVLLLLLRRNSVSTQEGHVVVGRAATRR